jgi:hypothetical protein
MAKKVYTSPWDIARRMTVVRGGETLDPGVNYFVEKLESLGCKTYYSCEGHPGGFYVVFRAPYNVARAISAVGYFNVEIENTMGRRNRRNLWSLRLGPVTSEDDRDVSLRYASEDWESSLKPTITR